MRRKLIRGWGTRFVIAAGLTAAMDLILYALAARRIDPVVWVAPATAEYRHHGQPVLGITGIVTWAAVILLYSAVAGATLARPDTRPRATILTALASLLVIAIVHPTFMPLLLPAGWRSGYAQFFENTGLPFGAARGYWTLTVLLTAITIPHAMITTLLTGIGRRVER